MIDLHSHTYYSDGKFSPAELVEGAKRRGVSVLAITDHDNTRGSREAAPLAEVAGIELIPAIEFTTRWPGAALPLDDRDVDVLGYFLDLENAAYCAFEEAALNDIHARIASCCARLTGQGYPVSMDEVFAENGGRYGGAVQMIQVLLRKRYATTWQEGLDLFGTVWFTGRESPFTIQSVIEQIHLAGGAAVLAHPVAVRPHGERLTAAGLRELVDAGLDGIEIYHYRLDSEAREYFLRLAGKFDLLITGGSDLHGWNRGWSEMEELPVTMEMVDALRERKQK